MNLKFIRKKSTNKEIVLGWWGWCFYSQSKFTYFFGTFTMYVTWDSIIDFLFFLEEINSTFGKTDREDFGLQVGSVTIFKRVAFRFPFALDGVCT